MAKTGRLEPWLETLSVAELREALADWPTWARLSQRPGLSAWRNWLFLGGRGAGKTRAGAEFTFGIANDDPHFEPFGARRIALVGETYADARAVMIEGESGLLAVASRDRRPQWNPSLRRLTWRNGAIAQVFSANDPEGLRGSQFAAAWCDEVGCPAVVLGAGQPNVFPDPKSSASALPWYSTGARSDLVQNRFLSAHYRYWNPAEPGLDPDRNPVSPVYGGPMIDTGNIFSWAWDARPFPEFPANTAAWSDGDNWKTGHWLTGRLGGCPVEELLAAICADFDVAIDYAEADGFLEGYVIPEPGSARQAIEPLLALFNIGYAEDADARGFLTDAYAPLAEISLVDAVEEGDAPLVERLREQASELPRQLEIAHTGVFSGYEAARTASRRIEAGGNRAVTIDVPACLSGADAASAAESRLRDFWIGRDTLEFRLGQKHLKLSIGDQIEFPVGEPSGIWRIERIEDGLARRLKLRAVPTYPDQAPLDTGGAGAPVELPKFGAPAFHVMNLPLAPADPTPRVHVVVAAVPWARRYGVWTSPADFGFELRGIVSKPAILGSLLAPLAPGPLGRWDLGNEIAIRLVFGDLASVPQLLVFNGSNAAAIRAANGEWEILQFADAELQVDGSWKLRRLLRAQVGTDPAMRAGAATDSPFVLLDGAMTRIGLSEAETGLTLNWRAGPATAPATGPDTTQLSHAHAALQLRPLSPVHIAAARAPAGDIAIAWIRRSRIDGDNWDAPETPLGESSERYRVEILDGGGDVLRAIETAASAATYSAADQVADFGQLPAELAIAVVQIATNGLPGAPAFAEFQF